MTIVLWALAALLAVVFLAAGAMKLTRSKERLTADPSMAWAGPFPPGVIKTIGALEVLAAVGLILPAALGVVPVLVPLAAVGLVLMMIGAALTHARRKEYRPVAVNIALLALAAFVAWGRLGPYAF